MRKRSVLHKYGNKSGREKGEGGGSGEVVEEGAGLDMVDTMTQIMEEVTVCKRTGMVETI